MKKILATLVAFTMLLAPTAQLWAQETTSMPCLTTEYISSELELDHTYSFPFKLLPNALQDDTTVELFQLNEDEFLAAHFDVDGCAILTDKPVIFTRSQLVGFGIVLS